MILLGMMLQITIDFQIVLWVGVLLYFLSGYLNSKGSLHFTLSALLQTVAFCLTFVLLVLPELPGLYYFILCYVAATILGLLFKKYRKETRLGMLIMIGLLIWVTFIITPQVISKDLSTFKKESLPAFSITDLAGNSISSESLKGNVVVLDFFGTWCKPCIKELIELQKIQKMFETENVVFLVVNADLGGDTPEKFQTFINSKSYDFQFAYDHGSKLYDMLKLTGKGLPVLLIIDKDQNVRFVHVGFNTAETNFAEDISEIILSLQ